MPIILSNDIIAATEQPYEGWSLGVLSNYKEKPNKDGTGVDQVFIFELLDGPGNLHTNKGRTFIHVVYSKAIEARVSEECRKLVELLCALTGNTKEELMNQEVDPSDFIGRTVFINIKDEPYEGRILKKAVGFSSESVVPF